MTSNRSEALANLLSEREREVMAYVAAHYRSKAIARLLGTAPKTVDAQIANACRKLGADSRDEAVRMLLQAGAVQSIGEIPPGGLAPMAGEPHAQQSPTGQLGEDHAAYSSLIAGNLADDDLRRSRVGVDAGGRGRSSQAYDPVSDLGLAGAGPVFDRRDGDVRDRSSIQLSGGHGSPADPGRLELPQRLARLGAVIAIAVGLAIVLPLGLYGAAWLQSLVLALQQR